MDTTTLLAEVNQALADLVAASNTDEISNTLVEMLDVMKARKDAAQPVVNVTNQVNPTPVTVENTVNLQFHGLKFSFKYDQHDRITDGFALPIQPKG